MTGRITSPLNTRRARGLWFALALLVLVVQTALPAHQDSHPLSGKADIQCQYCMLGGNLQGMPGVALALPAPMAQMEAPAQVFAYLVTESRPRRVANRGPPSSRNA